MTRNACIMKRFNLKKKTVWSTWKHYKTSLKNDKRNTCCTTLFFIVTRFNFSRYYGHISCLKESQKAFIIYSSSCQTWPLFCEDVSDDSLSHINFHINFLSTGKKLWKWKVTENFPNISKNITRVNNNVKDHWAYRLLHFQLSVRSNIYECMKTTADKSQCFLTLAFIKESLFTHYNVLVFKQTITANTYVLMINIFFAGIAFYSKATIKITRTFRKINVH